MLHPVCNNNNDDTDGTIRKIIAQYYKEKETVNDIEVIISEMHRIEQSYSKSSIRRRFVYSVLHLL